MIKRLKESIDPKYFKVCLYAGVTVILVAVALAVIYFSGEFWSKLWGIFKAVLSPIVIGGIISYLISPVVKLIRDKLFRGKDAGWVKPASVALAFILIILIISLIVFAIVATVNKSIVNIDLDNIKAFIQSIQEDFSDIIESIEQKISEAGLPVDRIGSFISGLVSGVSSGFTGLLFGIIFSVYFLLDGENISRYWKRAFRLIAGEKAETALKSFAKDADTAFSGYIRGQFLDAIILGTVSSIALTIAGIPSGLVVGLLMGVGNLIPYVGPIVGYLSLIVVCLLQGNISKLVIGLVILLVLMFLDGNVLNPRLLANSVKVHPLLVVAALIGGGALGGILGMLVAVPVGALIKLQFDRYLAKKEIVPDEKIEADVTEE